MTAQSQQTVQTVPEDRLQQDFKTQLSEHILAGYQCLLVPTTEEARVEEVIAAVGVEHGLQVLAWDVVSGFSSGPMAADAKYRNPQEALRAILTTPDAFSPRQILIFRDLDDFFRDNIVCRTLRTLIGTLALSNSAVQRPMIILTPRHELPPKLRSCIQVLDFALPDEAGMTQVFDYIQNSAKHANITNVVDTAELADARQHRAQCTPELRTKIVASLQGLSSTEAENCLSRCLARHHGFCDDVLQTILDEKASIIKKSEVLSYIPEQGMATRDEIGGYGELLKFIDRRALAYKPEARKACLDYPKGLVLLGVPGTGKSYVARAAARLLGLPGYVMDVGSVFGSLVGESEARMKDALRTVEAQRGCVLLLDEADKAFGGAADSTGDSGVTRRVFGQLLTWLSEKNDRTFVIMTLNRTKGIPPEFLRAGRFDKVFYTDLPHKLERREIFNIHLRKRGVDPAEIELSEEDLALLIEKHMDKMVGSEIEQAVVEAKFIAFEDRQARVPTYKEFVQAASSCIPLATLDAEGVKAISAWCKGRATPVSAPLPRRRQSTAARQNRAVDLN